MQNYYLKRGVKSDVIAHIKNMMKGNGGVRGLVQQIDYMRKGIPAYTPIFDVAFDLAKGGYFLVYNADILKELHKWGFKDTPSVMNFTYNGRTHGYDQLYFFLVAKGCNDIYFDYIAKHSRRY